MSSDLFHTVVTALILKLRHNVSVKIRLCDHRKDLLVRNRRFMKIFADIVEFAVHLEAVWHDLFKALQLFGAALSELNKSIHTAECTEKYRILLHGRHHDLRCFVLRNFVVTKLCHLLKYLYRRACRQCTIPIGLVRLCCKTAEIRNKSDVITVRLLDHFQIIQDGTGDRALGIVNLDADSDIVSLCVRSDPRKSLRRKKELLSHNRTAELIGRNNIRDRPCDHLVLGEISVAQHAAVHVCSVADRADSIF